MAQVTDVTKITQEQARYLAALGDGRTESEAAAAAGVSRPPTWRWRQDPEFAELRRVAIELWLDELESRLLTEPAARNDWRRILAV